MKVFMVNKVGAFNFEKENNQSKARKGRLHLNRKKKDGKIRSLKCWIKMQPSFSMSSFSAYNIT